MDRAQAFWAEVKSVEQEILKNIAGVSYQTAQAIYIVTTRHRQNDYSLHPGGKMSIAKLRLAAKLMVEGTHRLASTDEIQAYLKIEDGKRAEALRVMAAGKNTMSVNVNIPDVLKG